MSTGKIDESSEHTALEKLRKLRARKLDRLALLDEHRRLERLRALGLAAGRMPPLVSFLPTPQAR